MTKRSQRLQDYFSLTQLIQFNSISFSFPFLFLNIPLLSSKGNLIETLSRFQIYSSPFCEVGTWSVSLDWPEREEGNCG